MHICVWLTFSKYCCWLFIIMRLLLACGCWSSNIKYKVLYTQAVERQHLYCIVTPVEANGHATDGLVRKWVLWEMKLHGKNFDKLSVDRYLYLMRKIFMNILKNKQIHNSQNCRRRLNTKVSSCDKFILYKKVSYKYQARMPIFLFRELITLVPLQR